MYAICCDYVNNRDGPVNVTLDGRIDRHSYDPLPRLAPHIVAFLMLA
jgi:hypothetical protein